MIPNNYGSIIYTKYTGNDGFNDIPT